ncbi:hypothetical protein EV144_102157 [Flavobacterium sp. 270]|uniref:hypothetical protein n=1 Tax=Flavobacterium sp. 270 TaxID=2512114 RepID=UPI00106591A9|nr:hypothetical protein [Flavobacterium sp. 270]TDW49736.1 hypothetical protein EV144_102157 [Flavobacterium sp. 270]
MKKFNNVIERYTEYGISEVNIEYAIQEVLDGTKREYIVQSLTADYRGMTFGQATALLNDLYLAGGGEFKRQNRKGYFWAFFFLLVSFICSYFTYHVWTESGIISLKIIAGAVLCFIAGIGSLIAVLFGFYREEHEPF